MEPDLGCSRGLGLFNLTVSDHVFRSGRDSELLKFFDYGFDRSSSV